MSNRLRQNRYYLCGSRTKSAILGVVLLVFILPTPSGFNGGASPAQAQTESRFPPFQLVMNQRYSHPVYPELRIEIDNRLLLIMGLPHPWEGLPHPIVLSELPENKWIQLRTPPTREARDGEPLPVAVVRGSCNVMRGCSVMAQWLP